MTTEDLELLRERANNGIIALLHLQEDVHEWAARNFGPQISYQPLLGVVEEVGELCHAHLKEEQGIRESRPGAIMSAQPLKEDALGDVLVYMLNYCAINQINLARALFDTWYGKPGEPGVRDRDWKKFPKNGLTE